MTKENKEFDLANRFIDFAVRIIYVAESLPKTKVRIRNSVVRYSIVSAQYFGEPEFMRTSLDSDWRWRNIQTSLLRAAKPRRYSHHGGEVYNPARNSP